MNTEKKYKGSVYATICYVLAALLLVYTCYQAGTTVKTINDYYSQYQMSAQPMEYVTYILQGALEPFIHTVVFFMLGYIINEVRKCNPANYESEAEKADAKDEKKAARDAKQAARGDAAAAKKAGRDAAEVRKEEAAADKAVVANFADTPKEDRPKQARKSGGNNNRKNNSGNGGANKPKKSGEGKKEVEARKNNNAGKANNANKDSKDNKDNKDNNANRDRKPAGNNNKKNNSGSGSKPKKAAEAQSAQKPKAKTPAADDDNVEIPWEVNVDFTADVHNE